MNRGVDRGARFGERKDRKWDGDYGEQHKKDKRITMEVRRQDVRGEKSLPDWTTNGNQSALNLAGFKFNCSFKVSLSGGKRQHEVWQSLSYPTFILIYNEEILNY